MHLRRAFVLAVALAFAAACGGGNKQEPAKPAPIGNTVPPAAAQPMTVDQAGALALALADKLAKAIEDGGTDCPKMGQNLKALTSEMKAAVVQEAELEKDEAKKAAFKEKFEPQLEAKLKDSLPKLGPCMGDPEVKGFIEAMGS